MKLYLDPGHGGADPGATGSGLAEKDITLDIALKIRTILVTNYENIEVLMSRSADITKGLAERTNEANSWGADFYMSIHINAFNGTAQGYEDYIHNSLSNDSVTAKYRDLIHAEVIKLNQLINRGKKKADYHVLRETAMPAMLSENGFIDHPHDAALMKQDSWRQNVALGHANGIAKAFGLKAKSEVPVPGTIYKVIAGSFKLRANADNRVTFLHSKNIEAFVVTTTISGETWYRVQAGVFSNRSNAEARLQEVHNVGITDAFIMAEPAASSTPSPQPVPTGYAILGPTYLSPEQMNRFAKSVNPNAPELGSYYLTFGEYYGIRGDVAFSQALHETNYFRFTGIVKPEQNNFAGIGATGPSNTGASFITPEEGVLAHIQHLYAYAATQPLLDKYPQVDPRFHLVKRGSASTWTALNGKWAVPGTTYGQSILSNYEKMINFTKQNLDTILQSL